MISSRQTNQPIGGNDTNHSQQQHLLLRPLALFLDGMARAIILPFGPTFVYRLVFQTTVKLSSRWWQVSYPLAIAVAAYSLGRFCGSTIFARYFDVPPSKLPGIVARLAGATISLHVFTLGAGLTAVWLLVVIRFLSATLVGILCGITSSHNADNDTNTDDATQHHAEECMEAGLSTSSSSALVTRRLKRRHVYVDLASGTAKIYLTSVAVSILSGGLLYRIATKDETFQRLTAANRLSLSPIFLVGVAVTAEVVLRFVFRIFDSPPSDQPEPAHTKQDTSIVSTPTKRLFHEPRDHFLPVTNVTSPSQFSTIDEEGEDALTPLSEPKHSTQRSRAASHDHGLPPCRERFESTDTEFYDCNSVLSDLEALNLDQNLDEYEGESSVCIYKDRRCVYANGTPAYVAQGDSPDTIPPNYLAFCGSKQNKANEMYKATQKWRYERHVWQIHSIPNNWFPKIKEAYPHFLHGFSKQGYPIMYEQPGKMNLKYLFRNGCEIEDMVRHYTFLMEYISNCVCTKDEVRAKMGPDPPRHNSSTWGIMVVMDIQGASLSHLSGDVIKYLKQAGDINSAHYPLSMKRAFLVNSPFWLAGAWSGIKGVLPDSVQVDILSASKYTAALRDYIDDDQIPPEYGGSSPYRLGEHPYEVQLTELVQEAANGEEPEDVAYEENEAVEPTLSFDHNSRSWVKEVGGVVMTDENATINTAQWRSEFTTTSQPSMGSPQPLRRRVASTDRTRSSSPFIISSSAIHGDNDDDDDEEYDGYGDDEYHADKPMTSSGASEIFIIASAMYVLWSAVQGIIETVIPLWILTPPEFGGLGYAPSRSGVSMFCAAIVLLWVMRTKVSRVIAQMPSKAPMRSFRIGVGAESVLLLLIAVVPKTVAPAKRTDTVLIMTFTIVMLSCTVLSSMLGRSASTILHRIAADSFAQSSYRPRSIFSRLYGIDKLYSDAESGKLTTYLNVIGEVVGVLAVAPLSSWSLAQERPTPFDGTCCLHLSSLITLVLYIFSFSLHLNVVGEFAPHPRDGCSEVPARRCGSFLCEVVTVSVGDMASLFEEANWSLTPLLGNCRDYAKSGQSNQMTSKIV